MGAGGGATGVERAGGGGGGVLAGTTALGGGGGGPAFGAAGGGAGGSALGGGGGGGAFAVPGRRPTTTVTRNCKTTENLNWIELEAGAQPKPQRGEEEGAHRCAEEVEVHRFVGAEVVALSMLEKRMEMQ